jgi:hypothetical protein
MLVSIDIAFYGPQIRFPYIMIVEAPLLETWVHGVDACLYSIAVPNLLSKISMEIPHPLARAYCTSSYETLFIMGSLTVQETVAQ